LGTKQGFIDRCGYLYKQREEVVEEGPEGNPTDFVGDEEEFAEEFGWYPMLYIAAKEDYLKIEEVLQSPAIEFLTFMNFYTRKSQLDAARIARSQNTSNV
jgi:hypothetical protein